MKQRWLTLFFAGFLLLAPVVSADDGSVAGALQNLIDQLVSILVGADEVGDIYPPHGNSANNLPLENEGGLTFPPNG